MSNTLGRIGFYIALYGTVAITAWIGAFKFHPHEAQNISGLIQHSPLMSWLYSVGSVQGISSLIGTVELTIATLMALYPLSKKASLLGALLASGLFLTTQTFLFSTPGVLDSEGFFPSLLGAFLIKDVVLLGVSLWVAGQSWEAIKQQS